MLLSWICYGQPSHGNLGTDDYSVEDFFLNGVPYSTTDYYAAFDYTVYGIAKTGTVGSVSTTPTIRSRHYIKTGDLFTVKRFHSTDTTSFTYVYLYVAKILNTGSTSS